MDTVLATDKEVREADASTLVGLHALRQAVVTRCDRQSPQLPVYEAARDSAAAELRQRLAVAEAARAFVWEPENWEAYQDSKTSNSAAWPPEFLLLAQAVEETYGAPPTDDAAVTL